MPTVTNAQEAYKQLDDYMDDALSALDSAETVLNKINYEDEDSIRDSVSEALDKITDAIYALRG